MYNNNIYSQNLYGQFPYVNVPCYICPLMRNNYGYYQSAYDNFYRSAHEEDFTFDDYDVVNTDERNIKITREHVENIAANIKKEPTNILNDIAMFIKDTRLLDYLLACLITYICRNYYKYKDVIEEKTDDLVEEMKENLPWVFDILKLFGITSAMVDRFLDNLIRLTVVNLRKLLPSAL